MGIQQRGLGQLAGEVEAAARLGCRDDRAVFSVMDDGPGVPPEQLPQLGGRFFRASNSASGGSGLGLAIARAVAERHGGELVLSNLIGGAGFCASLTLPFEISTN
jgi:two-component system sensor histidine kinase TctE